MVIFMLKLPECLKLGSRFSPVLEYFQGWEGIPPDVKLLGIAHAISRGGLHAARKNCGYTESSSLKLVDIDFSSYYAYIMAKYVNWTYSKMSKADFCKVLATRIRAKWEGNKEKAAAMKAIIAPAYGLLRKENPQKGLEICLLGQLFLMDLLEKLEAVKGIELIQTNTDGIILTYPTDQETDLVNTVEAFKERVKIPLEYQQLHSLLQQDGNYYVAELGEAYTFRNAQKLVISPDTHAYRVKGKVCAPATANAIAEKLLNGKPVTESINAEADAASFSLKVRREPLNESGLRWYAKSKWLELGDAISTYAVKEKALGPVYRLGYDRKLKRVTGTSEHTLVTDKKIPIGYIDKGFYIGEAQQYLNLWEKKGIQK